MLNEYKDLEPIIYRQMTNSINGNLSHAYLFNTNGNVYAEKMINAFVKAILCKEHGDIEEYNECNICKRIDEDNYPELLKIYPDGTIIKKEQIDYLQKNLSTKSLEGNKRVYIIYGVDKLNSAAANSLLKFLEEPSDNIISILITDNYNQVLNTIVSRCQVLTFSKNKVENYIKYNNITENITLHKMMYILCVTDDKKEKYSEFLNNFIKFIEYYDKNGIKTLTHIKEYFFDYFSEKEDILNFMKFMILFYRDLINEKIGLNIMYFDDYADLLNKISSKYDISLLLKKLNIIVEKESLLKYNVNTNMFIDSLIIDLEV